MFYRTIAHAGRHTLIAVNMSAGTLSTKWRFARAVQARVLFENRAMQRRSRSARDMFVPWGVHLYQW